MMCKLALMVSFLLVYSVLPAQSVIYYVSSNQADCSGAISKRCLLVKKTPDAIYTPFDKEIVGFNYEPGTSYKIKVEMKISDSPADGVSSVQYKLVEIMEQKSEIFKSMDAKLVGQWNLKKLVIAGKMSKVSLAAFIKFEANAMVSGDNSCNRFFGSCVQDCNSLSFGGLGATKMFCSSSYESDFMQDLSQVNSYQIKKNSLYLYHEKKIVMVLVKSLEKK